MNACLAVHLGARDAQQTWAPRDLMGPLSLKCASRYVRRLNLSTQGCVTGLDFRSECARVHACPALKPVHMQCVHMHCMRAQQAAAAGRAGPHKPRGLCAVLEGYKVKTPASLAGSVGIGCANLARACAQVAGACQPAQPGRSTCVGQSGVRFAAHLAHVDARDHARAPQSRDQGVHRLAKDPRPAQPGRSTCVGQVGVHVAVHLAHV